MTEAMDQLIDDLPQATARLRRQPDGFRWIVDTCPYCGRRHTHGGGPLDSDPRAYLTHRVAHCLRNDGYTLIEKERA